MCTLASSGRSAACRGGGKSSAELGRREKGLGYLCPHELSECVSSYWTTCLVHHDYGRQRTVARGSSRPLITGVGVCRVCFAPPKNTIPSMGLRPWAVKRGGWAKNAVVWSTCRRLNVHGLALRELSRQLLPGLLGARLESGRSPLSRWRAERKRQEKIRGERFVEVALQSPSLWPGVPV